VNADDVSERALRIAFGDDQLSRRIAHQLVIRKFHDRPLQEIQEPRILTHTLVAAPVGGSVAVTYLSWKGESMILSSDLHKIILPFLTARKISLAAAPT